MRLGSRRSLFAGLGGAAAATVATQLPAMTASAASPSGATIQLVPAVGTRGVTITVGGPGQTQVVVDLVGLLIQPTA